METVHVFISTGRFSSFEEMRAYIDKSYTEDGEGIDSPFLIETGLENYDPMCIESVSSETGKPVPIATLLLGASWLGQWLPQFDGKRLADAAICVFLPNTLEHPEGCSLEYLGKANFEIR
ncbi:MAG: immunity 22 family protein [Armatimonas sp.]